MGRSTAPVVVLVLVGVLAIGGCGSSSTSSSAGKSSTASATASRGPRKRNPSSYAKSQLAAAQCIRSHGVPSFPDPTFGAGGAQVNLSTPAGMLTSAAFLLAEKKCAKLGFELAGYAPTSTATAAEMAQALAVATCIRAHGVPDWPDPSRTLPSNLNGDGVQGAVPGPPGGPVFVIPKSIDIEAPAVKHAESACHDD